MGAHEHGRGCLGVAPPGPRPGAPMPIPEDRLRLPNGDMSQLRERVVDRLVSDVKRQRRRTSRAYLRMVEPTRPHLIHAHFGWAGADSVLAARSLGVPLLVSFHGTDLAVYPQLPEWRGAYRHMLRHVQRATVSSRFLADRLRALGYEERLDVLPPGVRLERFPYRGPRPDPGELRLAFIGRLIDWKGLDVLLRALSLLRPPARLTVV